MKSARKTTLTVRLTEAQFKALMAAASMPCSGDNQDRRSICGPHWRAIDKAVELMYGAYREAKAQVTK